MPVFSQSSLSRLSTCHPDLQRLFREVIKHWDCVVCEGHRGEQAQNEAFAKGLSEKKWPDGKHNVTPSNAADVAPCDFTGKIPWKDKEKFYAFGGFVLGVATMMGIQIRWGGDWDGDRDVHDQSLYDLPHFELLAMPPTTEV